MLLKKLELIGFKSFADKTEFVFEPGVTAIVGPNGCGKSNVVDSVKWLLGEQSVKSLRGTEMADVIFNGSAGRKSLGFAEATLTMDNSDRRLALDFDEVAITRRVYRNGEGAYFINKTPCRLKDIKNLLLDTGMGMQCYSVIEQGKIDQILVSSTVERRKIFDEAAGVSKYKARRKEAQSKLERVEQNLLRLNDIVEEVEKQLRSVKYQAAKARRFREYNDEFKKLRVSYSLKEYDALSKESGAATAKVHALEDERAHIVAESEKVDAARSSCEVKVVEMERAQEAAQKLLADIRQAALAAEDAVRFNQQRIREQGELQTRYEAQVASLQERVVHMRTELEQKGIELDVVSRQLAEQAQMLDEKSAEFSKVDSEERQIAGDIEEKKVTVVDLMQQTSKLENELGVAMSERRRLAIQSERNAARLNEVNGELNTNERSSLQAAQEIEAADRIIDSLASQAGQKQTERRELVVSLDTLRSELAIKQQKRSGAESRLDVLRDLDEKQEGIEQGVREVLAALKQNGAATSGLHGMIGEKVKMDACYARAVEAALGHRSQTLVVEDLTHAMEGVRIVNESGKGRASFLPLSHARMRMSDHALPAGIIGRLKDFVEADGATRTVVDGLLGDVLLVENMQRACEVKASESNGFMLVTLAGEVIEPTGIITGGSGISGGGIISRAAERRTLETELAGLRAEVASLEERLTRSQTAEAEVGQEIERLARLAEGERAQRASRVGAVERLKERQAQLTSERDVVASEQAENERESAALDSRSAELRTQIDEVKRNDEDLESRLRALAASHETVLQRRLALQEETTNLKVALAGTRQQELALRATIDNLGANLRVREEELSQLSANIEDARAKQAQAREEIVRREVELETLRAKEQEQQRVVLELTNSRETLRDEMATLERTERELKHKLSDLEVNLGDLRLAAQEVKLKMENLSTRVRDDYQLDLAEMYKTYQAEEMNWDEVAARIEELRLKIANMGNVNLDAIDSEDALTRRAEFLNTQRADLNDARRQLSEIIVKLNEQSLQMFQETFAVVRENFQDMFRKLFGGGKADLFLENEQDILESGVEIIARPPGKEPRSISLLSGGEKVMTAVALLFAIFKSRPSPFCLLDEVDAALDEANIGRFCSIVQDFLKHSQFIIVTHSKRTMSVANVIYGITMQESGVSKKISVKFEDYEQQVA